MLLGVVRSSTTEEVAIAVGLEGEEIGVGTRTVNVCRLELLCKVLGLVLVCL